MKNCYETHSSVINYSSSLIDFQLFVSAVISGFPQGYGPPSAGGGRAYPPSLTGLAGGGNANASPGPGDLYADGSLPGYTAAAVAAAAAAAVAAGSSQTGNMAALAARVS